MGRHLATWIGIGVLSFAGAAWGNGTHGGTSSQSTYTPGRSHDAASGYSVRGSAVRQARGGGPASNELDRAYTRGASEATGRLRGRAVSDNQTRRRGAVNYTGASFDTGQKHGGTQGSSTMRGHNVPGSPGVSMVGDDFRTRTGARTTGMIPVRAPSSNEQEVARESGETAELHESMGERAENTAAGSALGGAIDTTAPTARGGGPASLLPLALRMPAQPVNSGTPTWEPRQPSRIAGQLPPAEEADLEPQVSALTEEDLRQLPTPNEDLAAISRGLLSFRPPTVRGHEMVDTAQGVTASPAQLNIRLNYPAAVRAIGGGPAFVEEPSSAETENWNTAIDQP